MPQFTPSDRETVEEYVERQDFVYDTTPTGPGLHVIEKTRHSPCGNVKGFQRLMEKFGWYVASYRPDADGNEQVIMPVTEVPDEA